MNGAHELGPQSTAAAALRHGARELQVALDEARAETMLAYLRLLMHWNRAFKLTAIRTPLELVQRHLLDALSIVPLLAGPRLLDVGSGAGVPGLVLAIAVPELSVTLLDPALKRTRFLIQAAHQLQLTNVQVVRGRLEDQQRGDGYASIVSRASLPLPALLPAAAALLAPGGRILAMLGRAPDLPALDPGTGLRMTLIELHVPGLDAARHVALVRHERR